MSQRSNSASFRIQLDLHSGMPVYRQVIDQVRGGLLRVCWNREISCPRCDSLRGSGDQSEYRDSRLPRVGTGGLLETHQGTGTFISAQKMKRPMRSASANLRRLLAIAFHAQGCRFHD